ncbi:MAG: tail fiber domain-containing protein [Phycisphaerales bacterium]|nr:tail fiber domain-containing protein [Phycisphaerales bacterium]MCB9862242.1 tail fiber domain-containing protein [Phycisphaerales bacterium]
MKPSFAVLASFSVMFAQSTGTSCLESMIPTSGGETNTNDNTTLTDNSNENSNTGENVDFSAFTIIGANAIYTDGDVGIGTDAPDSMLTVAGTIHSTSGGIRFPDGTTQTTAAPTSFGDITSVAPGTGLSGGGTSGAVTLSVNFAGDGSAATASRSDHTHNTLAAADGSPASALVMDNAGNATFTGAVDVGADLTVGGVLSVSGTLSYAALTVTGTASYGALVSDLIGTTSNTDLLFIVNNTNALRIESNGSSTPNIVGGYDGNAVANGRYGSVIVGGGYYDDFDMTSYANEVDGNYSFIGGGRRNDCSAGYSVICGGADNTASASNTYIGGGNGNDATTAYAAVVCGNGNSATGYTAFIGSGDSNTASGDYSALPGGRTCVSAGDYSFASGRRAKANHDGAFVFGDSSNSDVTSSVADEFTVRCAGGARFLSNSAQSAGVTLSAGGGSWSSVSDRNQKENVSSVDPVDVLDRVCNMPIGTWNYKAQADAIRHIGPMAQDFYAAFGVGESDLKITTIDADGVALAAIQGLRQVVCDAESDSAALNERLKSLERENAELKARLERIEAAMQNAGAR